LIEAAAEEFGEHGFAGARIGAIAARAGVNQQLISYYFDGKEGLYRALQERWRSISGGVSRPEASLAEIVGEYLRVNRERRAWARVLVWDGMSGGSVADDPGFFEAMVADMRRRQEAGEVAEELDPAYVLLALFTAGLAPTAIPQVARNITGLPPDSAEFQEKYAEQLALIIGRLGDRKEGDKG
jgi:AcrR family transcriptional regulator